LKALKEENRRLSHIVSELSLDNMNSFCLGIDVGGSKKGFHCALCESGKPDILKLFHAFNPQDIVHWLKRLEVEPSIIAIDCPPRCTRTSSASRLAERQLHRRGFRVQWTRHEGKGSVEWMQNGQSLWDTLRLDFPSSTLIEAFPTVAGLSLGHSSLVLPLHLLADKALSRQWKDVVDACICADTAVRFLSGNAQSVGLDPVSGEVDELGPIYY
jgi:predicted nuclease with RNAse H fold